MNCKFLLIFLSNLAGLDVIKLGLTNLVCYQ